MKKPWLAFFVAVLTATFASLPAYAGFAQTTTVAAPQTYTVVVGAEDVTRGIDLEAFFPATLTVHVGDKVHWVQNSNENHTVTFMAGAKTLPSPIVPAPADAQSPLMLNPQVALPVAPARSLYNGSTFANSGLMGLAPGQAPEFNLIFTRPGTYEYLCLIHGKTMSGKIIVVSASQDIPSPSEVTAEANNEMTDLWTQAGQVMLDAQKSIKPTTKNYDGTLTHYISVGYSEGQVDLLSFFPPHIVVHPGDTVEWSLSTSNTALHTVTFMNGNPDYPLIVPQPQPNGPPLLLLNVQALTPMNVGRPLTRGGVYSSGLMDPSQPATQTYSLKISNISGYISYECLVHNASGMTGWFIVTRSRS